MEIKGTKTEEILRKALSKELKVSFRYRYFAEEAHKIGMERIADVFEATALNEMEHARHIFEFLGGASEIANNLDHAVRGEAEESAIFYPEAARIAQEEGLLPIADFFGRMSKVEAKHEANFRHLLAETKEGTESKGRTVGHSAVEMAQVMLPQHANPSASFVHGGELMKLMDDAAVVVAIRHADTQVVTASVERINFLTPVRVGDVVIVRGRLTFTSSSSMEVRIEVEAESLLPGHAGDRVAALTAYFIIVALDQDQKATEVPPLILSTEEEERLFAEGQQRYTSRKTGLRLQ